MNRLGVFWRGARYRLDPVWPVLRWLLSTLVVYLQSSAYEVRLNDEKYLKIGRAHV